MATTTPAPTSVAEATIDLQQAHAALAAAEATLASLLREKTKAQEEADRDKLSTLRPQIIEAEDELAIAKAAIPIIQAALSEALAREANAARAVAYAAAKAKLAIAEDALVGEYPGLAYRICQIVALRAEADLLVEEVNKALPVGEAPLMTLQDQFFGWMGLPDKVLEVKELNLWVENYSGRVIPEEFQSSYSDNGLGTGSNGNGYAATKQRCRKIKYLPATAGRHFAGFSNKLHLPSLSEGVDYYRSSFSDDPTVVLDTMAALETERAASRAPTRRPEYRYEVIPSDTAD